MMAAAAHENLDTNLRSRRCGRIIVIPGKRTSLAGASWNAFRANSHEWTSPNSYINGRLLEYYGI
jgi:hypothetical protein